MYKEKRTIITVVIFMAFIATFLFLPGLIQAGNLESIGQTTSYARGEDEDIDSLALLFRRAWVEKTGQTVTYVSGDDGDLQRGVAWPNPRFTDNGDGTVKDNLTGLIWMKNANCFGTKTWNNALTSCNTLADGQCGLLDGSQPGDWRLPNRKELESLIHLGYYNPSLPNTEGTGQWKEGDPFTGVRSYYYWSSTTRAYGTVGAWSVVLNYGVVDYYDKDYDYYVWCVRNIMYSIPPMPNQPVPFPSCMDNSECGVEEYCKKPIGECGGQGSCTARPENCPLVWYVDPVCGCDGSTYSNDCYAAAAGVNVAYEGECIPY